MSTSREQLSPEEARKVDKIPFILSFLAVFAFVIAAIIFPDTFNGYMEQMQALITTNLGWASVFFAFCIMLFVLGIIFSPIGAIRIGGKDAKPEFGPMRWFAISLCSGIGIGILFWGIGEPIYHYMAPPQSLGIEAGSHDAGLFAISQSALHWSVAQYCIYAICGVSFALMAFNEKKSLSIISGLDPVMPKKNYGLWRNVIHVICLFSICCTVISSTGALIMMISSSMSYLTGYPRGFTLNASIAVFTTAFFVASSATGLRKGMSFLSKWNTRFFFFILFYVFFCGPTLYILNMGTESLGYFLQNFLRHSTVSGNEFIADKWADSWLIIYMAAFFAYGPPIGLYLARLAKGRTVRQFLLMNVLAPSTFVFFWINTFGSLAVYYQKKGILDVWNYVQTQGLESTVIGILRDFPLGYPLIILFVVVTMISFVTLVDPMTAVLATLSTKGISVEQEAPTPLKIAWGFNLGAVALTVVTLGGVSALKGMFAFGGALLMFLTMVLCWCIVKVGLKIVHENNPH